MGVPCSSPSFIASLPDEELFMRHPLAIAFLFLPAAAAAQTATIAPGMTRAQVVSTFGEPATIRTASEYTYLFYRNDCGRSCGMNDLVVVRHDSVVDAILRSPGRHYAGTSSSPTQLSRTAAQRGGRTSDAHAIAMPAKVSATAPPTSPAAMPVKRPTAEQLRHLRTTLLGSGLTSAQIRARLKADGYSEHLLDDDMKAAVPQSGPRMKPAPAQDTRPSIPAGEPMLRPTSTPAPATTTKPPKP
jgi:hypothetical protein